MSERALKLIREAKEKRLTRLDLGNCGLTELPDELFELTWLEELKIDSFYMSEVVNKISPNSIGTVLTLFTDNTEYRNLVKRKKDNIITIPKKISQLKNLKKLDISDTKINDLNSLKYLTQLQKLSFAHTEVKDLKFLKDLNQLSKLDISSNYIDDFSYLSGLINLKQLDVSKTNIKDLTFLKELKHLNQLRFYKTIVSDLSPLLDLNKLKLIYASDTHILDLTPLTNLKGLHSLFIYNTKVKDLTPLRVLKKLNQLYIYNTKVIDLLPIKELILRGVEVKWSTNFKGNGIYIKNIPIKNPPLEIVEQGNDAILNYWKQKEQQGTVELYEAKLIIVGEGATGKTTLFEKLKDKNHPIGNTPETHGINIHEGLPFTHTHIGDNTFLANLWDFGGQELQYMTHQFFLTPRALYVLMMDARRESPNLAYWFKIVSLLGRDREDSIEKVRLLLVFNKRGNTTGTPPQYQDQLKYYADSLDVQYLEVDFAENDYRFDNLQNCIKQSLVTLPIVKSQLPRLWKAVREDLREEAKTENYIDTKRFSVICSKHGITEEADQWLLSGYLHQLGSLLHFQNDKGLRRLVILSPQWAVDGVYTFLSEESIARNNGRFTETEFLALLARRAYNRDDADVILQLMTKNNFDICYEATEHNYVAAQLLPDNRPPQYLWEKKFGALQFRYQYPIMPKGLMSRLIVRLSEYIEKRNNEEVVWKKGAILSISTDKNNPESYCRVLMYEDNAESQSGIRQIIFEVMGDPQTHRKHALHRVREEVESLHKKWFRSIKADEMVPCCCSECTVSDNPQLYKLENLLKRRLKRPDTSCDVSGEDLMIQQLLEGVYDKGEIRDMENQGKY